MPIDPTTRLRGPEKVELSVSPLFQARMGNVFHVAENPEHFREFLINNGGSAEHIALAARFIDADMQAYGSKKQKAVPAETAENAL